MYIQYIRKKVKLANLWRYKINYQIIINAKNVYNNCRKNKYPIFFSACRTILMSIIIMFKNQKIDLECESELSSRHLISVLLQVARDKLVIPLLVTHFYNTFSIYICYYHFVVCLYFLTFLAKTLYRWENGVIDNKDLKIL